MSVAEDGTWTSKIEMQGPFAGITAGPDGTLYLSADAEGSVLAIRRDDLDG